LATKSRARNGRRSVIVVIALTTAGVTLAGGSMASAGSSGASGGGVTPPKPPTLSGVSCVDRCAGLHTAAPGAKIELAGRRLGSVENVKFRTKDGGAMVDPTDVASRRVEAKVPDDATDGKPRVIDEFGQIAKAPEQLEIVSESALPAPGSFRLADATVTPEKAFFYGTGKPTLNYMFNGNGATDVRIDLVDEGDGTAVRSWVLEDIEPNSEQTLPWNGEDDAGKAAKSGEYSFRIGGVGDSLSAANGSTTFGYYDHKFPIRGQHTYGDGIGAPRSGHTHQGQDVFADCGTPLEAARGGKVQFKGYHSSAGNYLVIDGKKTGVDYVYMHLKDKAEVAEGERVNTGQRIGEVGETGNASGCHLHFEMWSKPGWYEGGHFLNPTKKMKKWDRWS
jgi:murein DD-endopeptidase MepM/ murein hydrolase activator NlpD